MKIGEVYSRMMAFPAVVNFVAALKKEVVPKSPKAPKSVGMLITGFFLMAAM